jgi:hypothetical protein
MMRGSSVDPCSTPVIVAFFSGDCPLDRPGMDLEPECLANVLRQFAGANRLALHEVLFDKRPHVASKLVGAAWPPLLRH